MAVLESAGRRPSYMSDIEKYGAGGERVFVSLEENKIHDKGYSLFDVTKVKEYQHADIDFVISKDSDIGTLPCIDEVVSSERFEKIEVKLDTRALSTGNLQYEVISHGSLGWSVITKSDYIYMVLCEEDEETLVVRKILWLDMKKWNAFAQDRSRKKRINFIQNEEIVDFLCRISDMRSYGVILSERNVNIELK